jgi:hypothetical protein
VPPSPIALPADSLAKLSDFLRGLFGDVADVMEVHQVDEGGHAPEHFVAKTANEGRFGLKATADEAILRSVQASRLGTLLAAPNNCVAHQGTAGDAIPALSSRSLVITEWLSDGQSLASLATQGNHKAALAGRLELFLSQYGEWTALGCLFGIPDRHPGNWVWSSTTQRLTLVDTESAFGQVQATDYSVLLRDANYVDIFSSIKQDGAARHAMMSGVEAMVGKFRGKQVEVTKLLTSLPVTANYQSPWMTADATGILTPILSSLQ